MQLIISYGCFLAASISLTTAFSVTKRGISNGISVKSGVKLFLYVWDFYNRCYALLVTLTLAYTFFGYESVS